MTRLADTFETLRGRQRKALVVYLTAGDPDFDTSVAAALQAVRAGADVLEVGVPFSDPTADGPVIQQAMNRALANGGGFDAALRVVAAVREQSQVPIVVFGYLNPLVNGGAEQGFAAVARAGADAVLLVDCPPEEAEPYRALAQRHQLDWVSLVAPTTPKERAQHIARSATGFLYLVSMTGVTGGALSGVDNLRPLLGHLRDVCDIPICIGFGVRDRHTAEEAARAADGVVVGSAIVRALEAGGPKEVADCVRELRIGVDAAGGGAGSGNDE